MKKLIALFCILLTVPVFAETIEISWEQKQDDLLSLAGWRVFMGYLPDVATHTEIIAIEYTGQPPPYVAQKDVSVTGQAGQLVKVYFSIAAYSKNGNVRGRVPGKTPDGKDSLEIQIPFGDVSEPFNVIFEIIPQPTSLERGAVKKSLSKSKVDFLKQPQ